MSDRLRVIVFFLLIFGWLFFLGRAGLPLAHAWKDPINMRDTGTMFSYLVSGPNPLRALLMGVIQHVEGPWQYIVLNLYSMAIGDLFPLNPSTMQFPNTIFAFFTCIFAFLMCRKLFSPRTAYYCALSFALGPWLAVTIREPWYFNTISCLLHFSTLYFFASLVKDPVSDFYKIAAPASLALYLPMGLDWPSYLPSLLLFVHLSKRSGIVLRNRFNAIPALVFGLMVIWTLVLAIKFGPEVLRESRVLVRPFFILGMETEKFALQRLWENTLLPWGPQMIFALAGMGLYLLGYRKELYLKRVGRSLLDSMCFWLVIASPPLVASSGSPTYLYVLAMPTAVLVGLTLSNMRTHYAMGLVLVMLFAQFYYVTEGNLCFKNDERRRVLAAACFLIEQRPDLLAQDKIPFASGLNSQETAGGAAGAVSSYTRGRCKSLVIPLEFPVRRQGRYRPAVNAFVDAYNQKGEILADLMILGSEALSEKNVGRDFFLRLLNDPNIRWIARFREKNGEEIYVGEVSKGEGSPADKAALMDVKSLSDRYEAKYDRMSFLKKNMQYAWHY